LPWRLSHSASRALLSPPITAACRPPRPPSTTVPRQAAPARTRRRTRRRRSSISSNSRIAAHKPQPPRHAERPNAKLRPARLRAGQLAPHPRFLELTRQAPAEPRGKEAKIADERPERIAEGRRTVMLGREMPNPGRAVARHQHGGQQPEPAACHGI